MTAGPKLDRIDQVPALEEDARRYPSPCLSRVRRLEREGAIQGYHARLDPFTLDSGLVLYADIRLEGTERRTRALRGGDRRTPAGGGGVARDSRFGEGKAGFGCV